MAAKQGLKVIAFNGPPRSGKDTLANVLESQLTNSYFRTRTERASLSLPMRMSIFAMLGLAYSEELYEKIKDTEQWTGLTLRQMMIDLSERHVKPRYGKQFWVKSTLARVNHKTNILIISDLGFPEELYYLEKTFGVWNVLVVNVSRPDTSWKNDSRISIDAANSIRVVNDGTPSQAVIPIRQLAKDLWHLAHS